MKDPRLEGSWILDSFFRTVNCKKATMKFVDDDNKNRLVRYKYVCINDLTYQFYRVGDKPQTYEVQE